MRLIIAGSRETGDELTPRRETMIDARVRQLLVDAGDPYGRVEAVLCGECRGMDQVGKAWALKRDIPVESYPADWKTHGKAAGPIRNAEMAGNADALLLVRKVDSRGSLSMLSEAKKRGLAVSDTVVRIFWRPGGE